MDYRLTKGSFSYEDWYPVHSDFVDDINCFFCVGQRYCWTQILIFAVHGALSMVLYPTRAARVAKRSDPDPRGPGVA